MDRQPDDPGFQHRNSEHHHYSEHGGASASQQRGSSDRGESVQAESGGDTLTLDSTIVASETIPLNSPDIRDVSSPGNANVVATRSLIGNGTGGNISIADDKSFIGTAALPIAPQLNALASNGGPTKTHEL